MKFSWKLFMCTISIVAITLAFGGNYIVNSFFRSALSRETKQALDESGMIRFAFETATLNIPSKYEHLQDQTIAQIGATLDTGAQNRYIRISAENADMLYESDAFCVDDTILSSASSKEIAYKITAVNENYYIQTALKVNTVDREIYLETLKNITTIFDERAAGFLVYKQLCIIVLLCEGLIIFLLSRWLTHPVRLISTATRNMAKGEYSYRAKKVSNDELGWLTDNFNQMAGALEEQVEKLKEAARSQEEFVGAFAHELKTPLTAIIGYADMLRSQKLDEEKLMLSADYIYQEGRRLEKLSFNLLDIIVLKHVNKPSSIFLASTLFEYIKDTFSKSKIRLTLAYEESPIVGDLVLIKTLLTNLIDNAIKASKPEDAILLNGGTSHNQYIFTVKDHGCGISPEDLDKVTKAFYMADKSRSRSRHGAGLGLTLCLEIARLHGSELKIESVVGLGTSISFALDMGLLDTGFLDMGSFDTDGTREKGGRH